MNAPERSQPHSINSHAINLQLGYIDSLTPMRGIAAIWVMLFHIDVSLFYRGFGALLPRDASGFFSKGYLWVDFFFLLSGFVMAHAYSQKLTASPIVPAIKSYLWARFTRIYPLHLFTLVVLAVATPLVVYINPGVVDGSWKTYFAWSAIPSHLALMQAMNQHVYLSWNIVSWSIGAEWWTYVVSIPLMIFIYRRSLKFVAGFMLLASVGLTVLVYMLPEKILDITFNYGFWRCFFEFNIGLGLYQFFLCGTFKRWLAYDRVIVITALAIVVVFHFRFNDLLIIPIFSILVLALSYNKSRTKNILNMRAFQYLGDISYSIYMVHSLWFMVFWFGLPQLSAHWGITSFSSFEIFIYCALFVVCSLVSSHFTYRFIEVKARQKLRTWFR